MNKDDLSAWKNYDNKQYSLIPGVSTEKNFLDRGLKGANDSKSQTNLNKSILDQSKFQERQDRMKTYGFSRDVRDIYATSSKNLATSMGGLALLDDKGP